MPTPPDTGEALLRAIKALETQPAAHPTEPKPPPRRSPLPFLVILAALSAGFLWLNRKVDRLAKNPSPAWQERLSRLETAPKPPPPVPPPSTDKLEARIAALEKLPPPADSSKDIARLWEKLDQIVKTNPLVAADNQLQYLKQRDELTGLADQAIANGDKKSWDKMLAYYGDTKNPDGLRAACKSELMRARSFFLQGSRIPAHHIDPSRCLPASGKKEESELSPKDMAGILLDKSMPWQDRARAAMLLGQVKHPDSAKALYDSTTTESNLDVIREATISFGLLTGYQGEIFDIGSLKRWRATHPNL